MKKNRAQRSAPAKQLLAQLAHAVPPAAADRSQDLVLAVALLASQVLPVGLALLAVVGN